jgi:Flp pilus assembly protein TadD
MKNKRLKLNQIQKTYLNNLVNFYDLEKNFQKLDPYIVEALWTMSDDSKINDHLEALVNEFFLSKELSK